MNFLLWITFVVPFVLLLLAGSAWIYGRLNPEHVLAKTNPAAKWNFQSVNDKQEVAILIACYRGQATVVSTIKAALATGCVVYLVDDGSKQPKASDTVDKSNDHTAEIAVASGAIVLELQSNVGKPAALLEAYRYFRMSERYKAIAILDDDVTIEPSFIRRSLKLMTSEVAIVVGKNITWWPAEKRWNIWLAKRAYSYWNYQLIIRRLQSALNVMNCISGSNSLYRTELLDQVLPTKPPYIVDDTFWVLETHRRKLGKIVYAPKAHAYLQDPTTFREWYKQNLRWLWGTFQGVIGHRVGRTWSHFDVAYVVLMCQWLLYVLSAPITIFVLVIASTKAPIVLVLYLGGYGLWVGAAAIQLRRPLLIIFIPAIIVGDLVYRVVFVHAFIKALRQPTVENCVWESPTRMDRNVMKEVKNVS